MLADRLAHEVSGVLIWLHGAAAATGLNLRLRETSLAVPTEAARRAYDLAVQLADQLSSTHKA